LIRISFSFDSSGQDDCPRIHQSEPLVSVALDKLITRRKRLHRRR
jgi:hypothetical protein